MILPFVGQQQGRSANAGAVRYLNLYPHMTLDQKPIVLGTPGLTLLTDLGAAPIRGLLTLGAHLYVVAGATLYQLTSGYVATVLGTLDSGVGPVSMAHNGVELIVVDGVSGHLYKPSTSTFSKITAAGFPLTDSACFLDGYFIANAIGTNTYFYSGLYDGSTWNALDFNSAEAGPDSVVAVASTFGLLYVFGEQTLELHYNAGDPDSVFRRVDGAVSNLGCLARASVAKVGETGNQVLWLATTPQGQGFVVSNAGGSQTERVSTEAVEYQWTRYARIDDAVAYGYTAEGHVFYVLTFPTGDATWVYDLTTKTWHERQSAGGAHWGGEHYAFFDRQHVAAARRDGCLYALDLDTYTDAGETIIREVTSPTMGTDEGLTSYQSVQIDMERGQPVARSDPAYDKVVFLCHGNGAEGGTVFTDAVGGHVLTAVGTVQTDTAQAKFNGSSIAFDGTTAALSLAADTRLGFGTGDFTLEAWVRPEGVAQNRTLFDFRTALTPAAPVVFQISGTLRYFSTSTRITIAGYAASAWHHVAVCRKSGVTTLYLDGVPGTPWTDPTDYGTSAPLVLGSSYLAANFFWGNLAEVRVTKGFAQYDGAFVPPATAFLDTAPADPPLLMLQWSDDAGHTWCPPVVGAIGDEGDYTRRVIFRRLGRSFRRTWRVRISDPVKVAIIAATVKGT